MSSDDTTQIDLNQGVRPGTQLNGIYEIDERIASGGMGEVYRGHNIQTGDPVAIKIVLPDFAKDPTILGLFRKEASVLNHLAHNAIVRYYVFSIDPGIGRPYLAMEFVDGPSLADVIVDGPMASGDAGLLVARIASGLAAAHEAGVVHRDLSPDNIILSGGSVAKAKIIDFGIARSETIGGGTLLGGRFAGKYNFVSPEQLGLFGSDVSERSDIYSLGLVFAAALRGEALDMSGSQVDVVEKRRVVPPLDGIPQDILPLVEAMLQPDPGDRPASMNLIVEWLTPMPSWQYATTEGGEPRPPQALSPSFPPPDRTVLTTTTRLPLEPLSKKTDWPMDPYAAPRTPPRAAPSTRPPQEAPYRYIPSNPSIPPLGPRADDAMGEGPGPRQPGRRRTPAAAFASAAATLLVALLGVGFFVSEIAVESPPPTAVAELEPAAAGPPGEPETKRPAPPRAARPKGMVRSAPASLPAEESPIAGSPPPAPEAEAAASVPEPSPVATPPSPTAPEATAPAPTAGAPAAIATAPVVPTPETLSPAIPTTTLSAGEQFASVGSAVDWLKNYDGGSCFFARALSASDRSMAIEGFGRSVAPFQAMDSAFTTANGYEPNIGVRQIAEKQCGLADFMRQVEKGNAPVPLLELSDDVIKSGGSLQGTLGNISGRTVSLWLIDDQGIVYDLNQHLKRTGESANFNIKLVDLKTGQPLPQLIFAVSSDAPLVSLSHSEPMRLPAFLTALRAEITRDDKAIGVAAKYFELGG